MTAPSGSLERRPQSPGKLIRYPFINTELTSFLRDTSNLPDYPGNIPQFELFTTASFGGGIYVTTLVTDIDPVPGSVSFIVPSDITPGTYFVNGKFI